MEMELLSYILSRLEIYFIICTYRTSVFYVRKCARVREPGESDAYVRAWMREGGFVGRFVCVCVLRRNVNERRGYETPKRRDMRGK